MKVSSRLNENWLALWSLDTKAIALTRICLGLILIIDPDTDVGIIILTTPDPGNTGGPIG